MPDDDVTFPPDTITATPSDMPTFPTPDVPAQNPWDQYNPDPSKDPIFGPGGAGPDPQGLDPMPQDPGLNPQPLPPGTPPDMPTFPTPDVPAQNPWDQYNPDPANDPIFGPGGAGPDPKGPDF